MRDVWCVRADSGKFANNFVNGGYVGVGYGLTCSLAEVTTREELNKIYRLMHPHETSSYVIGQRVGQVARFLLEIKEGDYVITPAADNEWLYYGKITNKGYWFDPDSKDGCRYIHRRGVEWSKDKLRRSTFSVPFQTKIRSQRAVFSINQRDEFLTLVCAEG